MYRSFRNESCPRLLNGVGFYHHYNQTALASLCSVPPANQDVLLVPKVVCFASVCSLFGCVSLFVWICLVAPAASLGSSF